MLMLCVACLLTRGQTATWRCPPQSRCCPGLSELPSAQCPPLCDPGWPPQQSDHIAHRDTTTHPSKCSSLLNAHQSSWVIPPSLATMRIIDWNLKPAINKTFNYQIKNCRSFHILSAPLAPPLIQVFTSVTISQVTTWPDHPLANETNSVTNSKNCHFEFRLRFPYILLLMLFYQALQRNHPWPVAVEQTQEIVETKTMGH